MNLVSIPMQVAEMSRMSQIPMDEAEGPVRGTEVETVMARGMEVEGMVKAVLS
jgi:hypothetical protein